MENIEITNEYDIKILNLIFKKLFDNQIDYSTKQINEMRADDNPIIKMFKGVKRSVNFKIDLSVDGKIPRLDFIEMMEDSYEKSIIDFLSDEFTNNLLNNPNELRDRIKSSIMNMVYSENVKKSKPIKKEVELDKPKRKYTRRKNETSEK